MHIQLKEIGSEVGAQTLQIMRPPGMAVDIQGWILTVLYSLGLLVIIVLVPILGERRLLLEAGVPSVIALVMAIPLARCGMSTTRFESIPKACAGAILAALLFVPLGFFICIWVVSSLNRKEVHKASRTSTKETIDAG